MTDPSFESELRDLGQFRSASRSKLRKLTHVTRGLSVLLVLVLVGFLAALYGQVTTMYAPENFEGPLQQEAQNLMPKIEPELQRLWDETAPVFADLAIGQFEEALPLVREASQREFDTLLTNVSGNAQEQVREALTRVSNAHHAKMKAHFPTLSTTRGAEDSVMQWMETIESDLGQILAHLEMRYSEDLGELQATLDKFRPNEFEEMTEDELIRQFVHLWLMKADMMVLADTEGDDHGS